MKVPLFVSLAILVCVLFAGGCAPVAAPAPVVPAATPVPPTPTPVPPTATPVPPSAQPPRGTPAPVPPTATPVPSAPTEGLMDVVTAYETAVNSGDVSGVTSLFANVFMYTDSTCCTTLVNQQDLANRNAYDAAMQSRLKLSDCRSSQADQITCDALTWDDCVTASGFDSLPKSAKFTIKDMKIAQMYLDVPDSDAAVDRWDKFWMEWDMPFRLWVRQERKDERAKIVDSHGDDIASAEAGAIWAKLCHEYAALKK